MPYSTVHRLKTINPFFTAVWEEGKLFELRLDDRSYEVGDRVLLLEYDKEQNEFSGRAICATISYILRATDLPEGLKKGYVIFMLENVYPTLQDPGTGLPAPQDRGISVHTASNPQGQDKR